MNQVAIQDETIEKKRKRLIFRSAHRGTKEMDLILGTFAVQNIPDFTENELSDYDTLLEENDPDLYSWISGKEQAPKDVRSLNIYKKLQMHKVS